MSSSAQSSPYKKELRTGSVLVMPGVLASRLARSTIAGFGPADGAWRAGVLDGH